MFSTRPKRPILRAQLAAMNPPTPQYYPHFRAQRRADAADLGLAAQTGLMQNVPDGWLLVSKDVGQWLATTYPQYVRYLGDWAAGPGIPPQGVPGGAFQPVQRGEIQIIGGATIIQGPTACPVGYSSLWLLNADQVAATKIGDPQVYPETPVRICRPLGVQMQARRARY